MTEIIFGVLCIMVGCFLLGYDSGRSSAEEKAEESQALLASFLRESNDEHERCRRFANIIRQGSEIGTET